MARHRATVWAVLVMGAMLVGCTSDSTLVAAPEHGLQSKACLSDAQSVGLLGGVLEAGPYRLVVPPGALLGTRTLTMEQETCGQWPVRLGPEGTQFLLPATLQFDASGEADPGSMRVAWWNPTSNAWVDQKTFHDGVLVSAPITHFSRWVIN